MTTPFTDAQKRPKTADPRFSAEELALANRNHGAMLEMLAADVTPLGAHYLLNHFDVPLLEAATHQLRFAGAFEAPMVLGLDEIMGLEAVSLPVTLECAGNGRAGHSPRSVSMPWTYGAVGNSVWTGTPLAPLIAKARPRADVAEISFTGADEGFDGGHRHRFGRALTLAQLQRLDVLLVWGMNGQPLAPQHGAPLRIIVPGWYGMASVKWLTEIEALTAPYEGYQQVRTYRYRLDDDDPGRPVTAMRVKSLMVPPGVPDWYSRQRCVAPGPCVVMGRAWSGAGVPVVKVELGVGETWIEAEVTPGPGRYAWSRWQASWEAVPGAHVLRCRATDAEGHVQPLEPPPDRSGFGNNACHAVEVFVG